VLRVSFMSRSLVRCCSLADITDITATGNYTQAESSNGMITTCRRSFPILIHGRTYYVTCDLPHGHDAPCTGRATDWGAPTL